MFSISKTIEGFYIEDVNDNIKWKKISHAIRESFRKKAYEEHQVSTRHELAGFDMGPYDPKRREAAIRWARRDPLAYYLIVGAIQSPFQRSMNDHRVQSVCPRCNFENPHWDHLWECVTKVVPADVLLRR